MERVNGHIVPYTGGLLELASLADSRESAILEDAPVVAAYLKSKPDSKIQVLSSVQLPPATLAALGYSCFRWGIRKEDCSLGLAISRALLEVRANGVVRNILEKSGMGDYASICSPRVMTAAFEHVIGSTVRDACGPAQEILDTITIESILNAG